MGGDLLGWAFDPIGQAFAGGPFWSKDNKLSSGGGGGGGGRSLTPMEQQLIEAQANAFNQQQSQSAQTYQQAYDTYQNVKGAIPGVQTAARSAADTSGYLANRAILEGRDRRSQLESILAAQPGDINALRNQTLRPDIGVNQNQATQMAMNQARQPVWNPAVNDRLLQLGGGIGSPDQQQQFANMLMQTRGDAAGANIFNSINAQAQGGAQANPLAAYANQLQALSQANMIPGLEDIRTLAGRAGQIGAQPGAAETVLTPGAVEILSAAQRGETPGAIQRLFQSNNTAERQALENQFDAARQRLIDRGIRGGALERALAGLEGQRAFGISSQEARLEGQARDATLGLLGQGTTYGLTQPFQREQLALQGIQAGGQLEGLAGNLGLSQGQLQGNLANLAGNMQAQQEGLRQGYLNIGLGAGQALSNEALQLQNLRQQALTSGGQIAGDVYRNELAGTALQGQFLNENIRNALAANQAQASNIGLAGQMGAQQIASQLGISQQNAALLSEIMNQRSSLAGQLGEGSDMLRFSTAPNLLTQGVKFDTAAATAPGLALDLLTGGRTAGSGHIDLGNALAAINNARNYDAGPSRTSTAMTGAVSGAGTGFMVGGPYGALAGGILGGLGGYFA